MARRICVCSGAGCVASGAREVVAALRQELAAHAHAGELELVETGCLGPCSLGPVVAVRPEGAIYEGVSPADAGDIVAAAASGAVPHSKRVQRSLTEGDPLPWEADIPFFARQTRVALRNVGLVDPFRIEDCLAHGAWEGLRQVLAGWSPDRVIEEIEHAKLRGRGGAGFPTGAKWRMARLTAADAKYVVCNGDEGDPGAFMDRSLLEGDPHAVIEGMAIAAYAIGATRGFVYVRAEYPLAVERLAIAIGQARRDGYLGAAILGSSFSFDIEIRMGSGAFVCGEETALLASIEGRRGEPRPRPPFPVESGLWGKPTVINNVETLACVPVIVSRGAAWHAALGTARSGGTKVFALAGAIRNTGLVEVPIGTPLRTVIFAIGGGMHQGRTFKAVQMGGPSGGCIPASLLDTPVDYDTLQAQGAIMGSGGMIVLDETSCMVDVARFFLEFTQDESCGKCAPCRVGTKRMLDIVTRICTGEGRPGDIERLTELGETIGDSALCGLGQTSPNPVLSTIRHFRAEYEAHIHDKHCPSGVCRKLVRFYIDPALCIGCTRCLKSCPSGAITGSLRQPHMIDTSRCIRCGACVDACIKGAIIRS